MAYGDWKIDDIPLNFKITADYSNQKNGNITLNCLALKDNDGNDPRVEIQQFKDLECNSISNTKLLNGGTRIYQTGGKIVTITDGVDTWEGAVDSIKFKEDSESAKQIVFDIVLQIEIPGPNPPRVYEAPYNQYENMEYNEFTGTSSDAYKPPTPGEDPDENTSGAIKISDNRYKVTKFAKTVGEVAGSCERNVVWSNETAIKFAGGLAHAYMDSSNVGCTNGLYAKNFGFNKVIPANAKVKRLTVHVKYANNSRSRAPYYNQTVHTCTVTGPNFYTTKTRNFTQGRTPTNPVNAAFDSLTKDINVSENPRIYNDPSFQVKYSATLDRYKTCWVDYIAVSIEYELPDDSSSGGGSSGSSGSPGVPSNLIAEQADEAGYALGTLRIVEASDVSKVRMYGSACNGPAWIEVNGIRQEWHYSHDHVSGDTLKPGSEILEFELNPPTTEIMIKTSSHLKYGDKLNNNKGAVLEWIEVIYS